MIALLLAAAIDCAKFGYKPPAVPPDANHRELAERYANGDGVKRDFNAAAYFLCLAEEDMAPAEFTGMTEHLQRMRAGKEKEPLDFCQYVTSGYGMSYCAHKQYEKVMPELDRRLAAFPDAIRKSGLAFVRAESERIGELSRGGTAYAAIALGAEMEQKERLVTALERFSKERAPAASAAEAKRADSELNRVYRAMERSELLRDAQRAWIAYRDAFAAFYTERWKGKATPEELQREIVTQLTRERVASGLR
ncbi:MAG TPA: lysozyme inhibitor LprI family protein [Thermoanaerobaculia bacterium]|nr:lysozyme inhibitor LprI family protein [Thermoanaerobaculia bacterium]